MSRDPIFSLNAFSLAGVCINRIGMLATNGLDGLRT